MSGLMEQVLLLGRVEAGKLGFKSAMIDLEIFGGKLVDEMLSATNRKCAVRLHIENDLAGAQGDESLLRHIFSNLLSNAVKYSPEGSGVEFNVRRDGADCRVAVRDGGIGIPERNHARLFEPFTARPTWARRPAPAWACHRERCVELYGGDIRFESQVGRGTTFIVRLPLFSA